MSFKSSATLHCGFVIKSQCAKEEQLCYLRSILVTLEFPHSDFFSLSETLIMWLNADGFFFQFSQSSFLLSMRKIFQNMYLIENLFFHQNNFVYMLLINVAQNHNSYFACCRRGLRQYFHLQMLNCAGKRSKTFLPAFPSCFCFMYQSNRELGICMQQWSVYTVRRE